MMNRRSTRLRNKERQTVALTEPSERKSRHGRKLMPSKRMVDIKVSAENDDSPPLSSLANSANGNQTKNEKPKRRKSKVKRRFYADVSSTSLGNASQASSATNNDVSLDLDQLVCYTCRASHDYSDQEKYPLCDPLFDPSNAVLLCDAPNCRAKAYHQRCHFVPIFSIPRGSWICLLCQYEERLQKRGTKIDIGLETQLGKEVSVSGSICIEYNTKLLEKFDREAASLKAEAISEELARLTKSLEHSFSNIRTAEHTITFYTNTERLRKELVSSFPRISSEFVHAKIKYSQSKFKVRQQLISLHRYITDLPPRPEPRFEVTESALTKTSGTELETAKPNSDSNIIDTNLSQLETCDGSNKSICEKNIICCVCYDGKSTPQNDILLCDGKNCKRAFHMKCLRPKLTLSDVENHQNEWLCPFCFKLSELIHYVQETYFGDHGYDVTWETAEDVFPEARIEYRVALLLKERKAPVEALFGEVSDLTDYIDENHLISRASDEDDEDEDFCSNESEEESSASDSFSSTVSASTERGRQERVKKELAYLSGAEEDFSTSGSRTSKSTVFGRGENENFQEDVFVDPGKFDVRNILQGKRKRSSVDYKKLNADLFGESTDIQSKNATNDDREFHNNDFSDDVYSVSCTSHSSADTEKELAALSDPEEGNISDGIDGTNKCKKSFKSCDVVGETSLRSKRRRPIINYKVLAGGSPSEDGSVNSQRKKQRGVKKYRKQTTSNGKSQSQDNYSAAKELKEGTTENEKVETKLEKQKLKSIAYKQSKKECKEQGKRFCTCKRSKCLKLYCICFSNERPCIEGVCKCQDCGNSIAMGSNASGRSSNKQSDAAQCSPHELLLALKMEEPAVEEISTNVSGQTRTSSKAADDLPGLLLSLKATDPPYQCTSPSHDTSGVGVVPSSETAVGSSSNLISLRSRVSTHHYPESNFGSPFSNTPKMMTVRNDLPLRCSCRKSSCLKLYCHCYSQGSFCNEECECRRCLNKPGSPLEAINQELLTDEQVKLPTTPWTTPNKEDRKATSSAEGESVLLGRKHGAVLKTLGCSCRRSKCVKLYCVCYYNKIICSSKCSCTDCANAPQTESCVAEKNLN